MKSEFNWAYIGCGSIAKKTAAEIVRGPHRIVSVYSRNYEKAGKFAAAYGARAYTSFEEAVARDEVDGVYIATPHTSHVEYALGAMQCGKPVLCEKPVGVCFKDVEAVRTAAQQNGVYFAEAMWTWFCDPARKVKEWIDAGEIGEVKRIEIFHAFPGLLKAKTDRVLNPDTAGGALLDIGIYPITYCYNLLGYPEKIECEGIVKNGIDIGESITLTYAHTVCHLQTSFSVLKESCVIEGSEGSIELGFFHMANRAVLKKGGKKLVFKAKTDYLSEFTRAAEEIRAGKKESAYVPLQSTEDCMKIMDDCRKQMGLRYPFETQGQTTNNQVN
ncbi:MAG: Gfo/Idh/MocA family oxidoreductase [Ruminococcaceae bacterium]|nr:Gfo/Idh/MocA family oxidoreductase [Oscillospiraceae bacterium]